MQNLKLHKNIIIFSNIVMNILENKPKFNIT